MPAFSRIVFRSAFRAQSGVARAPRAHPSIAQLVFGLLATAVIALTSAGTARSEQTPVGTALVLLADVSASIDAGEYDLQRKGIEAAFRDPAVIKAIWNQPFGAMAVTLVEWSSSQAVIIPWTIIHDETSALAFADAVSRAQRSSLGATHIGDAVEYAMSVLDACPCQPARRVIDVSGDGITNGGRRTADEARDMAVALGVTVNGLPIRDPAEGDVRTHYEEHVIGGLGSFVAEANGFDDFARALRHKLVLEIADAGPSFAAVHP
ncbi:MAG TPA: DUF1194 domain-containing protein [Alphaproteobacteria bacterium]